MIREKEKIDSIKNIILSSNNLQELLCSPYKNVYYITKKSSNLKEYYTARINSKLRLIMRPEGEYPYNNLIIELELIQLLPLLLIFSLNIFPFFYISKINNYLISYFI